MRLVFFGLFLSASVAQAALALHLSFENSFATDGYVSDASGNGGHAYRFNSTNWITATNGAFGSQAGLFITNATMNDYTTNGQSYPEYPPGWPGLETNGVNFYHASQYLAITNVASFRYLTNFTLSFRAQFVHKTKQAYSIFLSASRDPNFAFAGADDATNSWHVWRPVNARRVEFRAFPSGGSNSDGELVGWFDDDTINGSVDTSTAALNHYCFVISCAGSTATMYYNGLPQRTNTMTTAFPWFQIYGRNYPWLCIGSNQHDGTPQWGDDRYPNDAFMHGTLDDLRIYDITLNAAQVNWIYSTPYGTSARKENKVGLSGGAYMR